MSKQGPKWLTKLMVVLAAVGFVLQAPLVNQASQNVTPTVAQAAKHRHHRSQTDSQLAQLDYQGSQVIDVNNGQPTFSQKDLDTSHGAWQKYGNLDSLNRATSANALLNKSLMPTAEREPLTVDPTGWHNKRIASGYLYNRSHLIGYQLTGQNNNWKNLITGTRSLNDPCMTRYEDAVAEYLKANPQAYVRYRVTPVFRGDEQLARGVHMQAQSVGSNAISYNVYIFNVQDGVKLNYQDGTSKVTKSARATQQKAGPAVTSQSASTDSSSNQNNQETVYITATGHRYHFDPNCRGLSNARSVTPIPLSQAQAEGYTKCGFE